MNVYFINVIQIFTSNSFFYKESIIFRRDPNLHRKFLFILQLDCLYMTHTFTQNPVPSHEV